MSGPTDERWSQRIRSANWLIDAILWVAVAVGAVVLGTFLVEEQWGDAAQSLLGGLVTALFGWSLYRGWIRWSRAADEAEARADTPTP